MFWKEFSLTFVEEKPLDFTKGIIESVLNLLLQSVFVHVYEKEEREKKRGTEGWADKQNNWYKIYKRKGSTLFLSFPSCCLWGAGGNGGRK